MKPLNPTVPLHPMSTRGLDPMNPHAASGRALTCTANAPLPLITSSTGYGLHTRGLDPMNQQQVRHWQERQEWNHQVSLEALRTQRLAEVQTNTLAQQEAIRLNHEQLMAALDAKNRADQDAMLERMKQLEDDLMKRVDSALNSF